MIRKKPVENHEPNSLSLVDKAAQAIEISILQGGYGQKGRLPGVRHLSANLGSSRDTVWRALKLLEQRNILKPDANGRYFVHPRLHKEELRTLKVLFITDGKDDKIKYPIFQRCYDVLKNEGPNAGVQIQLHLIPEQGEVGRIPRPTDAVLITPLIDAKNPNVSRWKRPVIGVGSLASAGYENRLYVDDFQGGLLAGQEFLRRGYRQPALLHSYEQNPVFESYEQRRLGFLKAMLDAGILPSEIPIYHVDGRLSDDELYPSIRDWLHEHANCDSVFGLDDRTALFVIDAARELDVKVPKQLGVIAFDGSDWSDNHCPTLACCYYDIEALCRLTIWKLRDLVSGRLQSIGSLYAPVLFVDGYSLRTPK